MRPRILLVDGWWIPNDRFIRDRRHPVESQQQDLGSIDLALKYARLEADWPGWQCVQAGARVGLWPSVLAARGAGTVHAFEPDPVNFECARLNLGDRQLGERVILRQAALGAEEKPVMFEMSKESGGEHHVGDSRYSIQVPMTTIDRLHLSSCAAIFLDIEGYDLEALRGANETLMRFKPVIVVEENALCERYGRARGDVEKFLAAYGYKLMDEFSTLTAAEKLEGVFHGSDLIFAVP